MDRHHPVTSSLCKRDRVSAAHGDVDRRRFIGEREDARVVDAVVLALVCVVATAPQRADDLDRLLEHFVADVHRRPPAADDVFVQVLAGPNAEPEASIAHHRDGRRLLGHDRRVVADRRAGDERDELDSLRLRGEREHAPGIRAVVVREQPRVEVVGDGDEVEPGRFGARSLCEQLVRVVELAHQAVAVRGHRRQLSGGRHDRRPPSARAPGRGRRGRAARSRALVRARAPRRHARRSAMGSRVVAPRRAPARCPCA